MSGFGYVHFLFAKWHQPNYADSHSLLKAPFPALASSKSLQRSALDLFGGILGKSYDDKATACVKKLVATVDI